MFLLRKKEGRRREGGRDTSKTKKHHDRTVCMDNEDVHVEHDDM